MPPPLDPAQLDRYAASVRGDFERMLADLVQVPTVSADAARRQDIRLGARLAAQCLEHMGAAAEIVETSGNPVVLGRLSRDPSVPTIAVYNHLDVQPAQEPEWRREPFTFAVEDGRYYARGATDDKGPALATLFAARYAVEAGLRVNVLFIWELEEEIGSPHFEEFVRGRAASLKADVVAVSDTVWLSRDVPAIPYALRGLQGARLLLETAERDAHSGLTGGAARNPVAELCQVIVRCHDAATGRVLIPGFYDDVAPIADTEMRSFLASGFTLEAFMRGHGLKRLRTMDVAEVLRRIWCQPTFEVHGIVGGYAGPGIKTVVPPRAEAKVSMRLVPNQKPAEKFRLLRDFLRGLNPDVQVEDAGALEPFMGQFTGPYAQAARAAIRFAFGKDPAFIREGGSIGAVVTLQRYLRVPIVFLGLSLPEHAYHGPNEHFDWGQASGGIKAFVRFFAEAAALAKQG